MVHYVNEEKTTGFHLPESIVRSKLGTDSSDEIHEENSLVGGLTADSVLRIQRQRFSMAWGSSEIGFTVTGMPGRQLTKDDLVRIAASPLKSDRGQP